ncbi:FUSC family protein [Flavobacterium sp. RHBU_3]|uniref:FUSC family protein n=1 Tax=Flavobacterium sp. RHBU_3 TaxID=3391184 RepID=UPI003984CA38
MKVLQEFRELYAIKPSVRSWHIPFLAAMCVGLPLLAGYLLGNVRAGATASMAGLVILYLPEASFTRRMITLMACSFGLIVSFFAGLLFSFSDWSACVFLGLYTFSVHWVTRYFKLRPPGNFFFIMLAAIGLCMPFEAATIPLKTGYATMGCIGACLLAFIYGFMVRTKNPLAEETIIVKKNIFSGTAESVIFGITLGVSLALAKILRLENPYWVPVSCLAVLQGVSAKHIWQRSLQRIIGTFLGLGLAYLLLMLKLPVWGICIGIMLMQFVVEMLITRNYGLAVIFITSLTLLLAEFGSTLSGKPAELVAARFTDIVLGSLVGAIGGYFVYHRKIKDKMERQLRKTRIILKR